MDITSMKTMLELQAIQSLGNSSTDVQSLTDNQSIFTQLLEEMLTNSSSASANNPADLLGSFSELQNFISTNDSTTINNDYLSNFLFKSNSSYIPNSYYDQLLQTNSESVFNNYKNKDYLNNNGYENVLAGTGIYSDIIANASEKYGVPEKLIAAVIKQESNFNENAVSSAGAIGLMQLMPSTARFLGVQDAKNPVQNIMGGTKYLSQMLEKFDNNIELALAAYNAGPGNVSKYNGVPPFKETINYVQKVINYYKA
ncbi:lytic transglycosylase domain-containing protein [Lysinibacillus telephonicus]|uniref:lytic transglycosylase domain-containing protein n=1 Tax=Lysinibacillus telephonicus TaxID=1714840 RepID=UPI003B9FD8E1